jgi:hypothetical protein
MGAGRPDTKPNESLRVFSAFVPNSVSPLPLSALVAWRAGGAVAAAAWPAFGVNGCENSCTMRLIFLDPMPGHCARRGVSARDSAAHEPNDDSSVATSVLLSGFSRARKAS